MASLNQLRKQARKARAQATNKIRRNTDKGIFLERSEFDPRRAPDVVNKYNSKQLQSYIQKLESFNSRNVQFVQGADREPLPRHMVAQLQNLEKARNRVMQRHIDSLGDVYIPAAGMTIKEREATIEASRMNVLRAGGNPQYRPYSPRNRDILGIPNAQALKQLIENEKRMLNPKWLTRALQAQKKNHVEFLRAHGDDRAADLVEGLTTRQFDILKNQTDYDHLNQSRYLNSESGGKDSRFRAQVAENNLGEAMELAEWAKTL